MASISVTVQAPGAQEAARDMRAFADATRQAAMAEDAHVAHLKSSEERLANFERVTRKLADAQKQASAQTAAALREETRARADAFRAIEREEAARLKSFQGSGGGGGAGGPGDGGGHSPGRLMREIINRAAPGLGGLAGPLGALAGGAAVAAAAFRVLATIADREVEEARATLEARIELRKATLAGVQAARAASAGQYASEGKSLRFIAGFGREGDRGLVDSLTKQNFRGAANAVASSAGLGPQQDEALEAAKHLARVAGVGLDEALQAIAPRGVLRGAGAGAREIAAIGLRTLRPGFRGTGADIAIAEGRLSSKLGRDVGRRGGVDFEGIDASQAFLEGTRRGRTNDQIIENRGQAGREADPGSAALLDVFKSQDDKIAILRAMELASNSLVNGVRDLVTTEGSVKTQLTRALRQDVGGGR